MNPRRILAAAIVPVLALLAPSLASAGPVWEITSDAQGGVGHLETVSWSFQGASETGLAGTLTTKLPSGMSVSTYCIDLFDTTYVGNGGSTWSAEVLPISSFANSAYGSHWGGIGYLYAEFANAATTAIEGAALQIAIWKVEYDGNNNLAAGNFQFADSTDPNSVQHLVYEQASDYLAGYNGTQVDAGETYFRATSHPNNLYQDLVGPGSLTPAVASVPEPGSIVLASFGIGAVVIARKRLRRPA